MYPIRTLELFTGGAKKIQYPSNWPVYLWEHSLALYFYLPHRRWRVRSVPMTTKEHAIPHERWGHAWEINTDLSETEPWFNSFHGNCLLCSSPVGDVRSLPLLPGQCVSPLPWPRGTLDFVRNSAAWFLHPSEKRREGGEAWTAWTDRRSESGVSNTRQHKAVKWTQQFSSWRVRAAE